MIINFAERLVVIKIVYYGPAAAGKTTSLQYLATRVGVAVTDVPLAGDRTIFFEFAPVTQRYGDWRVKFNFYTLPGQPRFSKSRALILRGAQGIVYVADSQYNAAEENLRMLADLQDKLAEDGLVLEGSSTEQKEGVMPIVLFYNKRDLTAQQIMPVDYMDATFSLRTWRIRRVTGSALTGENVLHAADLITSTLMRELSVKMGMEDDEQTNMAEQK